MIIRHIAEKPIEEKNINALGAAFIAPGLGIQDIYEIDKVVKLYGNRQVSGGGFQGVAAAEVSAGLASLWISLLQARSIPWLPVPAPDSPPLGWRDQTEGPVGSW